ncbi:MAG: hypothetical protein ACR2JX_07970 [Mycobacteriales bacterium]
MSTVYILGAGFSKAVSDHMPLMKDLSAAVAGHLEAADFASSLSVETFSGDFEAWMTFLSTEQPWLSESQNMRNCAAFYEVTTAVSQVLNGAQNSAFDDPMPGWLTALAHHWRTTSATVITFNYDELVEAAVSTALLGTEWAEPKRLTNVYPLPLTPASKRAPVGLSFDAPQETAFHLLKLHGSINWYYAGFDAPTNDPIYLSERGGEWERRANDTPSTRPDFLVDKVPFIVPPTAVKTGYYRNKILRAAWHLAAEALRDADELHVIGYSAPESDLLVKFLMRTNFTGTRVVSVDPSDKAADHLSRYLLKAEECEIHTAKNPETYVLEQLPEIQISCTKSEQGEHESRTLLRLNSLSSETVASQKCSLCPENQLQNYNEGTYTCPCCNSTWRGTTDYFYARGSHTTATCG